MTHPTKWAVIENAGYEGERVARTFATEGAALDFFADHYSDEEADELHVDVAHWDEDGAFWSYDH